MYIHRIDRDSRECGILNILTVVECDLIFTVGFFRHRDASVENKIQAVDVDRG